ncbi:MAG TPA: hypothetical protein VJB59_12675, partial [Bdellovibrionota bacterium]|nr:hypothetical protein [Bdellovibrionota bacterium]
MYRKISWCLLPILLLSFVSPTAYMGSAGQQFQSNAYAADAETTDAIKIEFDERSTKQTYGVYSENEVALSGDVAEQPVRWEVVGANLPPGFDLEDTTNPRALIFGSPQFQGQWCFVLSAILDSGFTATKQICFVSEDNPQQQYPKFQSDRFLKPAVKSRFFQEIVAIDRNSARAIKGKLYDGEIPEGLSVEAHDASFEFLIKGRFEIPGAYPFVLQIENELGITTYKQFQLTVIEEETSGGTQCPAGYYFDPNLGYCVQNQLSNCPEGTYYEPDVNQCVQFPTPPPSVTCAPGYYFDHFLSRCVAIGHPRCPLNYEWDNYYNRCVRLPYSCPIGYNYDWITKECVYVWHQSCPAGSHYDRYLDRCVANHGWCSIGYYWDRFELRCVPNYRYCGVGEYWDPVLDRCTYRHEHCGPGSYWDSYQGRCVGRPWDRPCGFGSHWSSWEGRCVPDYRPQPVPRPVPHPAPRPLPPPPRPVPYPPGPRPIPPRPVPHPPGPRP